MAKISIIVPVYNVEKYLSRCIESILSQSFTDFELLLIDDGSRDSSGAICDEYASKDARIRVFHKENGGVSSARNLGLDNARGEYVVFIDADDIVKEQYLEHLMYSDADLVVAGVKSFGIREKQYVPFEGTIISMKDFLRLWNASTMNYLYCFPIAKRFRLSIIRNHGVRFDERLFFAEDECFVTFYMSLIDSFVQLATMDYQYRIESVDRGAKYPMNTMQLIEHYNCMMLSLEKLEQSCDESIKLVKDDVNRRFIRKLYSFLQKCDSAEEYRSNMLLFRHQKWAKYMLGLLQGKKEKRVLYGSYFSPIVSFFVENKILVFIKKQKRNACH